MRDAWCKANLALSSPALLVDFHVSASSVVQVLSFSLADIYGAGVWTGVRVTGVAVREGLPNWALTNADLPVDLAGIGRGVFGEVGQVGVAHDRGIERFCTPHVGEESIVPSSPTRTARFVTSLRAARVSTGCSERDMDWVFMDGDVAKPLEVVYW